ncbi:hypothetical protein C1H46_034071 [Malus baccata]|uniref:Uncharacterized protein n=1 Tax=Malus baccata TaxID=106549 RepID=A0A540L281_MALBA|nr:hypothetical protein C1H46_034071 [Malus baccata]
MVLAPAVWHECNSPLAEEVTPGMMLLEYVVGWCATDFTGVKFLMLSAAHELSILLSSG